MTHNFQGMLGSKITYFDFVQKRIPAKILPETDISEWSNWGHRSLSPRHIESDPQGPGSTEKHYKVFGSVGIVLTIVLFPSNFCRVMNMRHFQQGCNVPVVSISQNNLLIFLWGHWIIQLHSYKWYEKSLSLTLQQLKRLPHLVSLTKGHSAFMWILKLYQ